MVNYGVSWRRAGGFFKNHQARLHKATLVKLLKFEQAKRLSRSSPSASHGIYGSPEPSKLKLLGVTLKSDITLDLRSCCSGAMNPMSHNDRQGGLQGNMIRLEGWMRSTGMSG